MTGLCQEKKGLWSVVPSSTPLHLLGLYIWGFFFLFLDFSFFFSLQAFSWGIFPIPCHILLFIEKLSCVCDGKCALVTCGFPDFELNLFFWISMKQEVLIFNYALIQQLVPARDL